MAVDHVKVAAAVPIWNRIELEPLVVDIDWMFLELHSSDIRATNERSMLVKTIRPSASAN
jgi:hypothetical protein